MFVTNWISTTKIQKISEITNFFRHYFLSRTEVKTTITAIKLLILRSFQRKGLCNSGLKAKSTTFVNNIKTEYNGRKQYNSR